jgi:hypothetical protein
MKTFIIKFETADGEYEYGSHFLVLAKDLDNAGEIADKILDSWQSMEEYREYKTREIMEVEKKDIKVLQNYLTSTYWSLEDLK